MPDNFGELLGAAAFGAIIGWYVYYINRYRTADVQFSDLTTVVGIIGGGAVLELFGPGTALFGAYGLGLFAGFFAYFLALNALVRASPNFTADFFLDGRRRQVGADEYIPAELGATVRPMDVRLRAAGPGAAAMEVRLDQGQQPVVLRLQPGGGGEGALGLARPPETAATDVRDARAVAEALRTATAAARQALDELAAAGRVGAVQAETGLAQGS